MVTFVFASLLSFFGLQFVGGLNEPFDELVRFVQQQQVEMKSGVRSGTAETFLGRELRWEWHLLADMVYD